MLVGILGLAAPRFADAAETRHAATEFGLGVASVVCTLGYGLAKTIYAVGGTVTGGLAWALTGGRSDVARAVIQPAVRGDYVITPQHLTGRRSLVFAGRDPELASYPYP